MDDRRHLHDLVYREDNTIIDLLCEVDKKSEFAYKKVTVSVVRSDPIAGVVVAVVVHSGSVAGVGRHGCLLHQNRHPLPLPPIAR